MMLHGTDLVNMLRCRRYGWEHRHTRWQPASFYYFDGHFSDYWSKAYGLEDTPMGQTGDSMEDTLHMLEESDQVRFGRIVYRDLRITIPLLEKKPDGTFRAVWAHRAGLPREDAALLMYLARLAASKAGIEITEQEVIYLNRNYVRQDELDIHAMLVRDNKLFNRKSRPVHTIEQVQEQYDIDLDSLIDKAQAFFAGAVPAASPCRSCSRGRRCHLFDICFEPERHSGDDLLFLKGLPSVPADESITGMADLDLPDQTAFPAAYAQIAAAKNGKYYADLARLDHWLDAVSYPVSYLDFEWDTFGIPPYKGMHPYDVLCFQFSLHVEQADGTVSHTSFFESGDCRKNFIESLLTAIPKEGTVLVYNMEGAEQLRLKQLAAQFPEYAADLEQIWKRMMDLSKPFEKGWFYDLSMKGRYSLKQVLPVFSREYDYHDLSIQNGTEAVHAYRAHLEAGPEEKKEIADRIATYCAMDTYAELLVLHGLQDLADGQTKGE